MHLILFSLRIEMILSGGASDAISMSLGSFDWSMSRTQPPTKRISNPESKKSLLSLSREGLTLSKRRVKSGIFFTELTLLEKPAGIADLATGGGEPGSLSEDGITAVWGDGLEPPSSISVEEKDASKRCGEKRCTGTSKR